MTLEEELQSVLNKHSAEGVSNTPDFILATFVSDCLDAFNVATRQRDFWRGYKSDIASTVIGETPEP